MRHHDRIRRWHDAMRHALALSAILSLASMSCTKASEAEKAKRMPKPPPEPSQPVQLDAPIGLEVDGEKRAPVASALLAKTKPDFSSGDRRAWKIARLASLPPDADAEIEVESADGVRVSALANPPAGKPILVLVVNRRGSAHAALVRADDPFPAFHGQGGRLSRPGDPLPRIGRLRRIRIQQKSDASE